MHVILKISFYSLFMEKVSIAQNEAVQLLVIRCGDHDRGSRIDDRGGIVSYSNESVMVTVTKHKAELFFPGVIFFHKNENHLTDMM